jgi:hypothetical protein
MSFSPDFIASQTLGNPSNINLTDNSTGSDVNISSRNVYFTNSLNNTLVQNGTTTNYEIWGLSINPISFDVLEKDYALNITVDWVDSSNAILYSITKLYGFTMYNETFDYQLTQVLSGNPLVINDNDFFKNKSQLRLCIDSGNQALDMAQDIFAAQQCYDRATNLRLNSPYFFNANI